jgi:hypothetical protein
VPLKVVGKVVANLGVEARLRLALLSDQIDSRDFLHRKCKWRRREQCGEGEVKSFNAGMDYTGSRDRWNSRWSLGGCQCLSEPVPVPLVRSPATTVPLRSEREIFQPGKWNLHRCPHLFQLRTCKVQEDDSIHAVVTVEYSKHVVHI